MKERPKNASSQQREMLKQLLKERAQKKQTAPASCAQRRLWFIERMEAPNPSYNIPCYFTLSGSLDIDLLKRSLNKVVSRHAVLRTTFADCNGEPIQVVEPVLEVAVPVIDLSKVALDVQQLEVGRLIGDEIKLLFDLAQGPLLRTKVLKLSPTEYVVVLIMHHIISDGWSMRLIVPEWLKIYRALCRGKDSPLPRLQLQYIDFAAQQARWLETEHCEQQLDYWRQQLSGLPVLQLPTDKSRPLIKGYRGATRSFSLSKSMSQRLKKLCHQEGATLYMVTMAAFSLLLHRYCGQTDIVFGSPIANRNRTEYETLIGFFVNVVLMRTDLSGDPDFRSLLARVSDSALNAYANQDLPFERLVEDINPDRDSSRSPLFQVVFALQNETNSNLFIEQLEVGKLIVPGYDQGEFNVEAAMTRLDLELHLWEGDAGIRGTWSFDTDLFEPSTIDRMTGNFSNLLEGIVADPGCAISRLPLLTEPERNQLVFEWNQTATEFPADNAVHQLFEQWAERSPDAQALVYENESLSYAQLNTHSNQLAHHLQKQGVDHETLVGVCLERGIDLVICMLAIFKAGGAYLPLDPKYPSSRLSFILQDAGVGLVLGQSDCAGILEGYAGEILDIDAIRLDVASQPAGNLQPVATARSLAYVIYTSGSTGQPKGTLLEHQGLCKVSAAQKKMFGVGPGSRILQFASPNFDASLFDFAMALTNGCALVMASQENLQPGAPLVSLLKKQEISLITIPPSSLNVLTPESLPALKVINVAGEACPAELVGRWAPGRRFFNLYGPTECTIWTTATECFADGSAPHIGKPIANTRVYILDVLNQPVPIGVPGELVIGGVGLARGYLNLPEQTAEKFIANPFEPQAGGRCYRTGDKVRFREDGNIEFLGRIDDQVKIRGFRIEVKEIESLLRQLPGVADAAVVARAGADGVEHLLAYASLDAAKTNNSPLDGAVLRAHLRKSLPAYMLPAQILLLPEMPLNPNGKIDRKALPAPESMVPQRVTAPQLPESSMERLVSDIWKEVLQVEAIDIHQNFFDMGGHSLMMAQVHSAIVDKLGTDIPLVDLFRYATVSSLSEHLGKASAQQSGVKNISSEKMAAKQEGRDRMARLALRNKAGNKRK